MPVHLLTFSVDQVSLPAPASPQRAMFPILVSLRIAENHQNFSPEDVQRRMIDLAFDCQQPERVACYAATAGEEQLCLLVAWEDGRTAERLAVAATRRINRGLDAVFGGAVRLEKLTGDRRVRNRTQFEYLRDSYFQTLPGLAWNATSGFRCNNKPAEPAVALGMSA